MARPRSASSRATTPRPPVAPARSIDEQLLAALEADARLSYASRIRSTQHAEFELAVQRHPAVLECYTTAGQADYLLHVLVASIGALDALLRDDVSRMPGAERLSTTVGMKTIKRRGRITDCAAWAAD
jgi:hypothetical protein